MRMMKLTVVVMIVSMVIIIQSCEKEGGNETKISHAGGTESHNMGKNCMGCHSSGGEGSGWFTAAGTAYNAAGTSTYSNVTVQLYTQPMGAGDLVATLYGDAKGNFYTTAAINFGSGVYPVITGTGSSSYMLQSITQGACNSCHGVSTGKLYAN